MSRPTGNFRSGCSYARAVGVSLCSKRFLNFLLSCCEQLIASTEIYRIYLLAASSLGHRRWSMVKFDKWSQRTDGAMVMICWHIWALQEPAPVALQVPATSDGWRACQTQPRGWIHWNIGCDSERCAWLTPNRGGTAFERFVITTRSFALRLFSDKERYIMCEERQRWKAVLCAWAYGWQDQRQGSVTREQLTMSSHVKPTSFDAWHCRSWKDGQNTQRAVGSIQVLSISFLCFQYFSVL